MISVVKKWSCEKVEVRMSYDDVCEWYTVDVFLSYGSKFFTRDYKTKGSAMRSYNSWVTKLSAVYENFSVIE